MSKELVSLTRDLWLWCLERNIHIQAQYLPGIMNDVADRESRSMKDRSDWKLDRSIFLEINEIYGPLEVDLFASRLTNQCHRYFSWRPDPFAEATDAFLQDWTRVKGFANPPWNLILRVLMKAQCQGANIILVTPAWKTALVPPPAVNASGLATPATQAGHHNRICTHNAPTGHVEHLRERLGKQGLSGQATDLILKSWRTKTNKSFDSMFGQWNRWCVARGSNPFSGPVSAVANFFASLYQDSVNAYRTAISSVHEKVDGVQVGQHPVITRLIKGVFNERPPVPRYSNTWDVQKVLSHLESLGQSESLSLKALSLKTVFLLAITRPSRSADLSQLDISRMRSGRNGVTFLPVGLSKQSRQGGQ